MLFYRALVVLAAASTAFSQQISFDAPPVYEVVARAVETGDFNNDGVPDVVAAYKNLSLLFGNGDGSLAEPILLQTGSSRFVIAVGELNGDANLDIVAAAVSDPGSLLVLLGNGDGTFDPPVSYAVGARPFDILLADFDGDLDLDVATANLDSQDASILLGDGDGGFQPAESLAIAPAPVALTAGDFNNDSFLDLVAADYRHGSPSRVAIALGNGDGSFQSPTSFFSAGESLDIAAAQLTDDSHLDLVAIFLNFGDAIIYAGNGDGSFDNGFNRLNLSGDDVRALILGDFNGDSREDVAVAHEFPGADVFLKQPDGSMDPDGIRSWLGAAQPLSSAAADLNGDSVLDLVIGDPRIGHLSVHLGNGNGAFAAPDGARDVEAPRSAAIGDFDGDGHEDYAALGLSDGPIRIPTDEIVVYLGAGDATFEEKGRYEVGEAPRVVRSADLDGDTVLDLVSVNNFSHNVTALLGNGDGTFQSPIASVAGAWPRRAVVAEFNGDTIPDLAVANPGDGPLDFDYPGTVSLLFGLGDGSFEAPRFLWDVVRPCCVTTADFNNDGDADLAAASAADSEAGTPAFVTIYLGAGDGTFEESFSPLPPGWRTRLIAATDVNGDTKPDLALGVWDGSFAYALVVQLGNGDGTFAPSATLEGGGGHVAFADFNGDTFVDIGTTASRFDSAAAYFFAGNGAGAFDPAGIFLVGRGGAAMAVGDFNKDLKPDILTDVGLLLNTSP